MIEVKHLTRVFGDCAAVDDLCFKINNGKIYGLLGPDGAGKSTVLQLMSGCLAPTEGTVKIDGFDMVEQPIKAKQCIGYLPEYPPVYGGLTPYEFLCFVAEAKGVAPLRAARQVHEALELTQLSPLCNRLIKNLPQNSLWRVGIAQAMLGNPDIILLDEPTAGAEPRQVSEIRELIRALGEHKTVILATCNLDEARELCDQLLILSDGQLIANAPSEELEATLADLPDDFLRALRGDKEAAAPLGKEAPERDGDYELIDDTDGEV